MEAKLVDSLQKAGTEQVGGEVGTSGELVRKLV